MKNFMEETDQIISSTPFCFSKLLVFVASFTKANIVVYNHFDICNIESKTQILTLCPQNADG